MRRALLLSFALSHLGCAAIAGVDDYVAVDCVGACTEADSTVDDAADGFVGQDSSADEVSDTASDDGGADTTAIDGATDSSAPDSSATDSSATDTGKVDGATDTGPVTCATAPTKMVSLGSWSIDATEVTNAQYAAFLASKSGSTSGQPAYCGWNASFVPAAGWPAAAAECDFPVVQIDWCDARAYCAWAGKRLCGSPSGGATPFDGSGPITASTSQWYAACSVGGIGKYPYGDKWSAGVCVDNGYDGTMGTGMSDGATRVGSASSCHGVAGAYAELFDFAGNVREWEDDCDGIKDGGDNCRARGGAYNDAPDKATCQTSNAVHRNTVADNVGFRCCSP
jgi:formylglycine-generating enzyme required for sulfatase activity